MNYESLNFGTLLSVIITIINIGIVIYLYISIKNSKKRLDEIRESKKEIDSLWANILKQKESREVVEADIVEEETIENKESIIELINFQLIRKGDTPDLNLYAIKQPNNILRRKVAPLSEIVKLLNNAIIGNNPLYIEAEKASMDDPKEHMIINNERAVGVIQSMMYHISEDYDNITVTGCLEKRGNTPTPILSDTIYPVFAQRHKPFSVQYEGLEFRLVEYIKLIKFYYKAI